MDLSIVIPVYNTPVIGLTRCFDAIQFKKDISFEVIIVDDGSGEETGAFCRKYAEEHERFRYFYQKNQGVGAARNAGIRLATGTYITFLDGDDVLVCGELLPEYLNGENDLVIFDLERHGKDRKVRMRVFDCDTPRALSRKDCLTAACGGRMNSACGRLFRLEMLKKSNIFFDERMLTGEDAVFVLQTLQVAEKMYYGATPIYQYYHSYESGNGRLLRFPQRIFDDLTKLYDLRNELRRQCGLQWGMTREELDGLKASTAGLFVHAIFESISLLVTAKVACDAPYGKVRGKILQIDGASRKRFSFKSRMKYWVLKYDLTWMMKLFARLRDVYLKVKR